MSKKEKADKEKNLEQQKNKTPELAAAKKALQTYYKENNLDPTKDHTKDPKHGKAVTKLLAKLNKERDKVAAKYPETDKKAMGRIEKQAKRTAKKEAKVNAIQEAAKKEAKRESKPTKYDYPLVDGREMTSAEKKKYRMEQRKLKAGGNTPKKDNASSAEPKKGKKKEKVVDTPKKGKKAKKEED